MNATFVKRAPLLIALLLLSLVLAGTVAARPDAASPQAGFQALQNRAAGPLEAHWNAVSGTPDFLAGQDSSLRLPYVPTAAQRGHPQAIAQGFLEENRALYRMASAGQELSPLPVESDQQLGYSNVRLEQVYRGIPVFGRQLIVHLDAQEQIVAVNGHFAPGIHVATQATLTPQQAEQVALRDLLDGQLEAAERERVTTRVLGEKTRLVVYADEADKATLTWSVTIMTESPLGQWRYFVNARRPAVVHCYDSLNDAKRRLTYTADNGTDIPGRLLIDEGERSRDAVAQAAHDGAGTVYDYYHSTFKRDGVDGRGMPMVSTVHYGSDPQDAQNAAWIGEADQMIYGDGGSIFRPLAYGLDVVGHEFTHGVVGSTARLVYQGQAGALNESYADVFGALIDRGNWTIGEQIIKSPPYPIAYLRSLEDPHARSNYNPNNPLGGVGQPAQMSEYASLPNSRRSDNGGVHVNSGIPNRAAFLLAKAIGPEKMEQIYYRTLTQYLSPTADFGDAARATVRAAQDLYGAAEVEAVRAAFAQVGIDAGGAATSPQAATPTPTPSRRTTTPTPTPAPAAGTAGCSSLVANGGFEDDSAWTEVSTAHSAIMDTEMPHSGDRSAWLGGTDEEPLQYIYQDLTIPANATSVSLSYYGLIHQEVTGFLGMFAGDAKFSVALADTKGNVLGYVEQLVSSQGSDTWSQTKADLSRYAGKTVRLVFSAENPRNNVSSFFVDDVAVSSCTTGTGPAAPQTKSDDLVYIQGKITNADTGRGVEGAQVFVLKVGTSATQAAADDTITSNEVLTMGTSDANGTYQTQAPVPRNQTYSVIVLASGYRPILADDGVSVPRTATNPYPVNATLRKSR